MTAAVGLLLMHVAVWCSEAIAVTTWDDTLDTWLSVSRLRGELRGERSREILRQIFDSQELCDALGAALIRHIPLDEPWLLVQSRPCCVWQAWPISSSTSGDEYRSTPDVFTH